MNTDKNINKTTENIIFFYPSKIVGGAELLFARLANYLQEYGKTVYYIDYKDGYIRNNEQFQNINFINFEDDKKTEFDLEGTLITPISNIHRIDDYIDFKNGNLKLFFWTIHTFNLIHTMPEGYILQHFGALFNKIFMRRFCKNTFRFFSNILKECDKKNALWHMNKTTFSYNKTIFSELRENYLPILSEPKNIEATAEPIFDDEINIAILGRLCEEKTLPLLNVLRQLNKFKTSKKINAYIIGDGICKKKIKPEKFKKLNIIFKGTLQQKELGEFLAKNVDILFSMGTSLLEGAALKLPVVSIPYSYKNFNLNKFYFLYDSKHFNLGTTILEYKKNAKFKLSKIIELIYEKNKKAEIGQK